MKRRHFIRNTATGIILPSVFHGFGMRSLGMNSLTSMLSMAEDNDLTLVMIYLAGGNDGLNTLIPLAQIDNLNHVRPHVALREDQVMQLGNLDMGMHPAMQGMKTLFDEERLAIVQNVGYPEQNYSHFRSTDIWISGSDSDVIVNSGWSGRYLSHEHPSYPENYPNEDNPHPLAIEIGYSTSLMFQGDTQSMGYTITDPSSFYELLEGNTGEAPDTRGGERLEYVRLVTEQSQSYGRVVEEAGELGANISEYPDDNILAQQLKICARLISGGLKTKLYLVELGGFDTHDNQVEDGDHTIGEHADLLRQLSEAIKIFMDDCDALDISDRILGMTFSEFGRRIISNASLGTDHGAAAPLFLFGNHVKGGIYGNAPEIPRDADWSSNLDMEFDFRQIYATILNKYFCHDADDSGDILYGDFEPLDLIKGTECTTVTSSSDVVLADGVSIYPNPTADILTVKLDIPESMLSVDVIDQIGRKVVQLDDFYHGGGKVNKQYSLGRLPTGVYHVRIKSGNQIKGYSVVKR